MRQKQHQEQHQQQMDPIIAAASLSDTDSDEGPEIETNDRHNARTKKSSMSMKSRRLMLVPWLGCLVWPFIVTVPLVLAVFPGHGYGLTYEELFPKSWYHYDGQNPKPLGLCLGIFAVAVGQVFVLLYFYLHRYAFLGSITSIQTKGAPQYEWSEGLLTHLAQPEGFVLLGLYLSVTWMFHLMPRSYYSFQGTIQWPETIACLIIQDGLQFGMHRLEHIVSPWFYRMSHKPHHKFTNPRLFDAFNGSMTDTICMILIPLYCTAMIVRTANVWTYMAFGSLYANWLTMIHSEYAFPWDRLFRTFGLGTPGDHHVHHKFFKFNYGHLFMWFDQIAGTYKDPQDFAKGAFNPNV